MQPVCRAAQPCGGISFQGTGTVTGLGRAAVPLAVEADSDNGDADDTARLMHLLGRHR
jgi:hypothetical protein